LCNAGTGHTGRAATETTIQKGTAMNNTIEDMNKAGKDMMDGALKSSAAMTKGLQAIAAEAADYTKKSFEDGSKAMEKLMAVKTLDKAFEVQTEYAKSAYEAFVAQATKMTELMTAVAKDAYKPLEALAPKAK
jgi:phasin family protein